jgi:hypothetical protein
MAARGDLLLPASVLVVLVNDVRRDTAAVADVKAFGFGPVADRLGPPVPKRLAGKPDHPAQRAILWPARGVGLSRTAWALFRVTMSTDVLGG